MRGHQTADNIIYSGDNVMITEQTHWFLPRDPLKNPREMAERGEYPPEAKCIRCGNKNEGRPLVVFHDFNCMADNPMVVQSRGHDWYYCEEHSLRDPTGAFYGLHNYPVRIIRKPKALTLHVSLEKGLTRGKKA